jgi:hypothetical protein
MPWIVRRLKSLVVLCGVVCTLGAAAPIHAQNVGQSSQQNPSKAVLSTTVGSGPTRPSHLDTFAAFVREIGMDDLSARREAITGNKQPHVDWKSQNRTFIGLSDDNWQSAYAILLDASQQVSNWGDDMQDALGWKDGRFQPDRSQPATERAVRFDALTQRGDRIVEDALTKLRQQLGDEAFNKLDAFVYQREGGQRIINRGPIKRGPIETAKAVSPAISASR